MTEKKPFLGGQVNVHASPIAELTDVVTECGRFIEATTAALENPQAGDVERILPLLEQLMRESLDAFSHVKYNLYVVLGRQQSLDL